MDIKKTANEVKNYYQKSKNVEETKNKFKVFYEKYPSMFELLTSNQQIDMAILDKMIEIKSLMDKDVLSNEQGDKEVGNILFDKFVPDDKRN